MEDFYFIDRDGKQWDAPVGSCLNGATIPRALWTAVGAPYSGRYRRASVVHDVAVGELCNVDVSHSQRKKADRMFYEACRFDGCSRKFAFLLYIGVSLGTWSSKLSSHFKSASNLTAKEEMRSSPEADFELKKFWCLYDKAQALNMIETEDLDALDRLLEQELD